MINIKYQIDNFMTIDEFDDYMNKNVIPNLDDLMFREHEEDKEYFLLTLDNKIHLDKIKIHTFNPLTIIKAADDWKDNPHTYWISDMKQNKNIGYYISFMDNQKVIN